MEKDKRFNLYKQGLSDKQIAKRLGLSATGVNKWRKRHNLPSNHPEYHRPGGDTLCSTCMYAYGNGCFSLPLEERPWVKSFEVHIAYEGDPREYAINYVSSCDRYRKQKARVRLSVYQPERMAALKALQGIRGSAIT